MKRDGPKNIVASVQARLVERSRELGVEHQLTLARFGGERLLYRLSKSEFAERFILKGAALLMLWLGEPIRPTKDIDLLGFGDTSAEALKRVFVELCAIESPDDGLTFLRDSVHVDAIREDQEYGRAGQDYAEVLNTEHTTRNSSRSRWRLLLDRLRMLGQVR